MLAPELGGLSMSDREARNRNRRRWYIGAILGTNSSNGVCMRTLSLALTLALTPAALLAQDVPRSGTPSPLEVGAVAPDFSLPGATRYGLLAKPIHLSDFKGKTVVLAFFYKARTKG